MGKTYKKCPIDAERKPKGSKQAKINKTRNRPPSYTQYDESCFIPYRVAEIMLDEGYEDSVIIKKLKTKFKLPGWQATKILEQVR